MKRVSGSIESKLAAFPSSPEAVRNPRRVPRWFEIAFMLLVGPHLLVSVAGEIGGPDLFRGTPLSGTQVGPAEIAGFILIALRVAWPRIGTRLARIRYRRAVK